MTSSLGPYSCRYSIKKCLPAALYDWNIGGGGGSAPTRGFPYAPPYVYNGSIDLVRI